MPGRAASVRGGARGFPAPRRIGTAPHHTRIRTIGPVA